MKYSIEYTDPAHNTHVETIEADAVQDDGDFYVQFLLSGTVVFSVNRHYFVAYTLVKE